MDLEKIINYVAGGIALSASFYGIYWLFKDNIKKGYLKLIKKEKKNGN